MTQRRIYIAIPSTREGVRVETMRSVIEGMCGIVTEGWAATLGKSLECVAPISQARNLAVAQFLETDSSDLFFVDDDVVWQDGAMVTLLKHPVDFVAGVYPRRWDELSFPVRWDESQSEVWSDANGLIEVEGVAAGFLRLTRSACERLVESCKDDWYEQFGAPDGRAWPIFDFIRRDHIAYSEDYEMCRKWRALGGKVLIDPSLTFVHLGQKAWVGNVGSWLKGRVPAVKEAADD